MFMVNYGFYPDLSTSFRNSENLFYRRPGGFFQYGGELATFIPVVFYLILYTIKEKKYKGWALFFLNIVLLILLIALILTTVRGMVFAFILSSLVYFGISSKNKILLLGILPLMVSFISYNIMPQYMLDRYILKSRSDTMNSRILLSKKALSEVNNIKTLLIGNTNPTSHNKFIDELVVKLP